MPTAKKPTTTKKRRKRKSHYITGIHHSPKCPTPIKYRSKNFAMIQMLNCNENADVDKTNKKKLFTHKLDAQIYNTHDLLTMLKHYDKNDVKFNEFAESYKRVLTVKPT